MPYVQATVCTEGTGTEDTRIDLSRWRPGKRYGFQERNPRDGEHLFFGQGLAITSSIILRGTVDELEIPSTRAPEGRVHSVLQT